MRRSLAGALIATVAASAAALWFDDPPARLVAAVENPNASSMSYPKEAQPIGPVSTLPALPHTLEPVAVEPARRDIFQSVTPSAIAGALRMPQPMTAPPPPPAPPLVPVAVPTPVAPAVAWRYLGGMVTPAGERMVLLSRGDTVVPIEAGTQLDDGYVVQAIGSDAVRLTYPSLGTTVDVPIPPASPTP